MGRCRELCFSQRHVWTYFSPPCRLLHLLRRLTSSSLLPNATSFCRDKGPTNIGLDGTSREAVMPQPMQTTLSSMLHNAGVQHQM